MMSAHPLQLTADEQAMLDGEGGPGVAFAMRLVVALARATGAPRLVPIRAAHVDSCLYHGPASLDFARRLVDLGARVTVPTTSNVGSVDLLHPDTVRGDAAALRAGRELMDAYVQLGCRPTFTCAPYQLAGSRPARGDHVAWAESNAIVFVNSVLGARTERYGDFVDVSAAITGRVPDTGLHRDEGRRATIVLDVSQLPASVLGEEAGWGVLGLMVGEHAGSGVPAVTGLPDEVCARVTEDQLKALGAGAASSGGVGLVHVVGVTPEAPDLAAVLERTSVPTVTVSADQLRRARAGLGPDGDRPLDAVSLGTPHLSVAGFASLADLLADGVPFDPRVEVFASTSRSVLEQARERGLVDRCADAGVRIVTDTCTYVTTILGDGVRHAMTDSAKWAWYAPSNLRVTVTLGTMAECVASARAGRVVHDPAAWT